MDSCVSDSVVFLEYNTISFNEKFYDCSEQSKDLIELAGTTEVTPAQKTKSSFCAF